MQISLIKETIKIFFFLKTNKKLSKLTKKNITFGSAGIYTQSYYTEPIHMYLYKYINTWVCV